MVPALQRLFGRRRRDRALVYVNYGLPADYDTLEAAGHRRQRQNRDHALSAEVCAASSPRSPHEHGAVGCIIYSDPRDDGYFAGRCLSQRRLPSGRTACSAAACWIWSLYPGDPLSPGWASEPGLEAPPAQRSRNAHEDSRCCPISYADAQPLLANLDGPVAPEAWRGALPITYHLGPGAHARFTWRSPWTTRRVRSTT